VLDWIESGQLKAVNTSDRIGGKRWIVLPADLAAFELRRAASPPPKPTRRRRRQSEEIDFYPD
jgi:hypothetical protein